MSSPPAEAGKDPDLERVSAELTRLDPDSSRFAGVLRATLDQLYDGRNTGRYRWDQLHKTEKTHFGTLVEIHLHREFDFQDSEYLDYRIAGVDVDCKCSQTRGGWMLPPEAHGELCMLGTGRRSSNATLNVTPRYRLLWKRRAGALYASGSTKKYPLRAQQSNVPCNR